MAVKTYIQLGRIGDILNILPLLHADFKRGEKQSLMVASEFSSLLEGVSYVDPVVYPGPHYEIGKAVDLAKTLGRPWVCVQTNGPLEACREFVWKPAGMEGNTCPSFQMEPYRACGRLKEWNDDLPLVFDRRDKEREAKLIERVLPKVRGPKKKLMLVHVDGISSPFPYKKLLMGLLEMKFSKQYRIVDLGKITAERFFDLLGLYELADVLVAGDSAPLHLAKACPTLPVVALTRDKPTLWNGSAWQPQHIAYCRYGDFPDRAFDVLRSIKNIEHPLISKKVCVCSAYENHYIASVEFLPVPIELGSCGRDSSNTLNDSERHPYLKDALKMGLRKCESGGLLCLTKPKTNVTTSLVNPFSDAPVYAYRINRDSTHEVFQPVIDLLCAKKEFWQEHMKEIPDLIMGADYHWGNVLWAMFKKYGAVDATGCCWRNVDG